MNEKKLTIVEIIAEIMDYFQLNARQFCRKIGVNLTYVNDAKNGKIRRISDDVADKIISAFPVINRFFLITGEGDMLVENTGSAGVAVNNGTISNSGTIAGTMNASSPDLDALIHTVAQLSDTLRSQSDTLRSQSDTLNQQTTQISRLIGLLSDKE